ncbi:hypothetical protein G3T14_24235, partial [Methylobacterium sp. BTF04]|nr:hypothetical protein [Methylobacterium sp. BTF04]
MSTAQDQARDEAYASAPADTPPRPVVELDTPAFDAPLYFMAGIEDDVEITLEDGRRVWA